MDEPSTGVLGRSTAHACVCVWCHRRGSQLDVGVFLRLGPIRLYVPVEVSNIQFKARKFQGSA